jgi:hypothetical protein
MIVKKTPVETKEYKPVALTITFESKKDEAQFTEMIRHCDTVPDAILAYGSKIDRGLVHDIMYSIYEELMGG